jgi:probable addiction module antidote protein
MKGVVSFDKHLICRLKDNQAFCEAYLNEALNEGDSGLSLVMFRNVAEAFGGIAKLSRTTGLNRQNLYRALSGKRDPVFSTVESIVHGFGFKIKVEALKKSKLIKSEKQTSYNVMSEAQGMLVAEKAVKWARKRKKAKTEMVEIYSDKQIKAWDKADAFAKGENPAKLMAALKRLK